MGAAAPQSFEGRQLGRYLLRYRVAQGGMAAVYLAQAGGAHSFAKWVAVKMIHPHLAEDRRFVEMFLDEANLASGIHHANACSVLDFGEEAGAPYIVMEYLHGETFSAVVRKAWASDGMPPWLAARVAADAARGLHAAHELRGREGDLLALVHRDVSPQNVMVLYDGISKIMDFGIARAEGRITQTKAGEVKGKYGYMSPEQLRGGTIDRRTDVWALGVMLWEATVGRRLFRGESDGETITRVMEQPITRPSEERKDYPAALEEVVLEALERDPSKRTATSGALADGLDSYLFGRGSVVGSAQVAEWMGEHLAERRAKRETMLFSPGPVAPGDIAEVDLHSHSTLGSKVGGEDQDLSAATSGVGRVGRRRRGMAVGLAVGVALMVAGGAGAAGWLLGAGGADGAGAGTSTNTATSTATGTSTGTSAETDTATGAGTSVGTDTATGTATGAGTSAGTATEAEAAPDTATGTDTSAGTATSAGTSAGRDTATGTEAATGTSAETAGTGTRAGVTDERVGARAGRARRPARATHRSTATEPAPAAAPTGSGRLNLLAIPAAEVFLGSRSLGTTPLLGLELPAGQHTLRLRAVSGDAGRTVRVTIRPNEQTRLSVSL